MSLTRIRRPRLLLLALLGLLLPTLAAAQPSRDADYGEQDYFGPETDYEPQAAGLAKGHRVDYGSWEHCAREREICRVRGSAIVRYGADGRYVYREVRNSSFACDNSRFGDPAPRRGKSCDIRMHGGHGYGPNSGYPAGGPAYGAGDAGWQHCAREGEYCRVDGRAVVRYGAEGRYTERSVRGGGIACDNQNFGDPAPRQRKHCEVAVVGHGGGAGPGLGYGESGWTYCGSEGGGCELPGPATVRYGSNGRFAYLNVDGGYIRCDNRSFGDPAPRERKACEFQLAYAGSGEFSYCAKEGEYCDFRGRRLVRYGAGNGREIVREFRGGTACTNEAFGGDPAPRRRKSCEVLSGSGRR